jgi:hypothetical protein
MFDGFLNHGEIHPVPSSVNPSQIPPGSSQARVDPLKPSPADWISTMQTGLFHGKTYENPVENG